MYKDQEHAQKHLAAEAYQIQKNCVHENHIN